MSEMEHGMCISIEPLTDLSATILVPHNNNGSDLSSDDFTGSLHQIATSFFTTWILIVIYSSMIPKNPLSFLSISRSYNELVSQRDSPLKILDFLRVLAIVWVIANHTGSEGRIDILDRAPSAEGFKRAIHDHPVFGALLGNSALGVEIFLVLSGLLAACSWHRHPSSPFSSHYKKFILRRVVRLAPSVIIFIIFASGPVMNDILPRFHDSMISTCGVKGIASHLLFMGNLQETPTCMGYLWYLGLDMQLYLAAPLLLYVLHHRIRLGVVLSILIISLSCLLRALYCTTYGVCNKSDVDIPVSQIQINLRDTSNKLSISVHLLPRHRPINIDFHLRRSLGDVLASSHQVRSFHPRTSAWLSVLLLAEYSLVAKEYEAYVAWSHCICSWHYLRYPSGILVSR
ncbi:hypothetical protein WR25_04356 isoform D [Diploscapter pachys]|nr:hypothetical protein WR25_04356 isoform D [Diploscapter pachys]